MAIQVDHLGRYRETGRRHRHQAPDVWVALVAMGGPIQFVGASPTFELRTGDACLIPPGHAWSRICEAGIDVIMAWFQLFTPPAWANPLLGCRLPLRISSVPRRSLDTALGHWQATDRVRADAHFGLWLVDCIFAASDQGVLRPEPERRETPDWLRGAFDELVPRMWEHGWTVAGLAQSAGVSPSNLANACKRWLGESPAAILRRERVAFAVGLLRSGQASSVEQVSDRLGYPNARSFWRQCVAETGYPPSHWLGH
jgi:AraC-like DNA-binding protein